MSADDEFWKIAKEDIEAGGEVTIVKGNRVTVCASLKELWQLRAELEEQKGGADKK